ncbi:hypothetical protein HRbin17_02428 [bacterium HR17]|uniref:ParE-like toxin domain-containing protein n=1 Tax=Candidatus Fervidibacter japonicus TaxID=2035412 RepID=A0A2H5XFE2_9BACT|nr:hypothetical protein HRbin17_02428 [bacterium HR17]
MKSRTTERFRKAFQCLPPSVQERAKAAYRLFLQNPFHPSLGFKQVHPTKLIYSVRITRYYRALGVKEGDTIVWFWIGSHEQYERLLKEL